MYVFLWIVHLIVYRCTVCYLATETDWICDKNAAWFIWNNFDVFLCHWVIETILLCFSRYQHRQPSNHRQLHCTALLVSCSDAQRKKGILPNHSRAPLTEDKRRRMREKEKKMHGNTDTRATQIRLLCSLLGLIRNTFLRKRKREKKTNYATTKLSHSFCSALALFWIFALIIWRSVCSDCGRRIQKTRVFKWLCATQNRSK